MDDKLYKWEFCGIGPGKVKDLLKLKEWENRESGTTCCYTKAFVEWFQGLIQSGTDTPSQIEAV